MRQEGRYGASVKLLGISEILNTNVNIFEADQRPGTGKLITRLRPTVENKRKHLENIKHFEVLDPITKRQQNETIIRISETSPTEIKRQGLG